MDGFKLPYAIPQDLLFIQEFVGAPQPAAAKKEIVDPLQPGGREEEEDIDSSGGEDEIASEDEIAADLVKGGATTDDDEIMKDVNPISEPSDSSDETSSESDLVSDEEEEGGTTGKLRVQHDLDDDEDPIPAAASGNYFKTKNELPEVDIAIPEVEEIGPGEVLEKVGEVMSIIDRVAIVRGLPSTFLNRGSDRALDSDTLLVFDDRKVMGYIYETFGPTTQPLYQVKFGASFPLDHERVKIGREVFHVPTRSHFVFVSQIRAIKGSDASNVHDEEPGDDELEFSDDEAEAAYKSRMKRRRGESRSRSVASSRAATPNPALMRDQELADDAFLNRNAYDEHGPYDIDYSAGPSSSRPAPIPYDDPYGDAYSAPDVENWEPKPDASFPNRPPVGRGSSAHGGPYNRPEHSERGRGDRGRGGGGNRDRGRGGGSGRGRGRGSQNNYREERRMSAGPYESRQREARSSSPTSLAIARATGQAGYSGPSQQQNLPANDQYPAMYTDTNTGSWGYEQQMGAHYGGGYPQQGYQHQQNYMQAAAPFVQPHINPRFASAFGLPLHSQQGFNPVAQQQTYLHSQASMDTPSLSAQAAQSNWTDEWTVPVSSGSGEESKNAQQG